jgi:hypothetical protein
MQFLVPAPAEDSRKGEIKEKTITEHRENSLERQVSNVNGDINGIS